MSLQSKLIALTGLAATALAHGTVPGFVTDGVQNGGFLLEYYYRQANGQAMPDTAGWYAENLDNGFVEPNSYGSPDIICHKNAKPGSIHGTVAAGGTVEFQWTDWPESHIGPVFTYVANCGDDCTTVDKSSLKWVKIDEGGINLETQEWAATALINNNNTWVTTVPSTLAAGKYVFRHEIIAMHAAGSPNGAQNYPQCINIEVTGSGTDNPEGVLGTELYTADHPGIVFNPYTTITSYEMPGPKLYAAGDSGSAPAPQPTTPTTPTPTEPVTEPEVPEPEETETVPPPTGGEDGGSGALPETFTLETFISWLRANAGGSAAKVRRHARQMAM